MSSFDWNRANAPARSIDGPVAETDERRQEPRFRATGDVNLIVGGPTALAVPGRIVDVSQHGMRVVHMYAALTSGTMLKIESGSEVYTARVVWNRISEDGVESGFYLL